MKIDWFPYDAVKPREGGHYLITARYDGGLIVTTDDFYSFGWDDWGGDVIAWAELPEPYREAEEGE